MRKLIHDLEFWKYQALSWASLFIAISLMSLMDFPLSILPMIAWLCFLAHCTITIIIDGR